MRKATSRDFRIRIFDRRDDAFDSRFDQRVSAGRSAALMRMWLKRNICGSSASLFDRSLERQSFSVLNLIVKIVTFAYDFSFVVDYDSANERAGADLAHAARG